MKWEINGAELAKMCRRVKDIRNPRAGKVPFVLEAVENRLAIIGADPFTVVIRVQETPYVDADQNRGFRIVLEDESLKPLIEFTQSARRSDCVLEYEKGGTVFTVTNHAGESRVFPLSETPVNINAKALFLDTNLGEASTVARPDLTVQKLRAIQSGLPRDATLQSVVFTINNQNRLLYSVDEFEICLQTFGRQDERDVYPENNVAWTLVRGGSA